MKVKACFSALAATALLAMGTTPALGQQSGKITFVGSIVNQGCGTARHTYGAYTAQEKLNFDLQLNDCLSEIQSAVGVSISAVDAEGDKLMVTLNEQSSGMGVLVSPMLGVGEQYRNQSFFLGGEGKVKPLDIQYRDAAGLAASNTDKVYVILNLSYA